MWCLQPSARSFSSSPMYSEFHNLDGQVLLKALRELEKQGKCQVRRHRLHACVRVCCLVNALPSLTPSNWFTGHPTTTGLLGPPKRRGRRQVLPRLMIACLSIMPTHAEHDRSGNSTRSPTCMIAGVSRRRPARSCGCPRVSDGLAVSRLRCFLAATPSPPPPVLHLSMYR
jgi:hypothetical protein